jgi:hypothetical protein
MFLVESVPERKEARRANVTVGIRLSQTALPR